jgi:hypothetical protein
MNVTTKTTKGSKITLKEMKDIFKKHNLQLGFPVGQKASYYMVVTDWAYWYSNKRSYIDTDLYKFEQLIKTEYADRYQLYNPVVGSSTGVERV